MTQARFFTDPSPQDADWIRFDRDKIRIDEMLDHIRSDNRALDTLRAALERDVSPESAAHRST